MSKRCQTRGLPGFTGPGTNGLVLLGLVLIRLCPVRQASSPSPKDTLTGKTPSPLCQSFWPNRHPGPQHHRPRLASQWYSSGYRGVVVQGTGCQGCGCWYRVLGAGYRYRVHWPGYTGLDYTGLGILAWVYGPGLHWPRLWIGYRSLRNGIRSGCHSLGH